MQPITVNGFGVRKLRPSGYFLSYGSFWVILFIHYFLIGNVELSAQCQLACRGKVNVSLGDYCQAEVTPQMLLTSSANDCPNARFRVDVIGYNNKPIPTSPFVTGDYIKKELIAMVFDSVSKNSCWSKIYIEDKYGPVIVCHRDTVYCNDTMAFATPQYYDNCDPNPTISLIEEKIEPFDCDPNYIKKITRLWQGRDNLGNLGKICSTMFWLKRIPIDSVDYPKNFTKATNCILECNGVYQTDANGHPHPNVTGVPNVNGLSLWPSYLFYCNLSTNYEDQVIVDLPCKKKILRLWKVVEWWCGTANIRTHPQTIEILDTKPPLLHCPYDFTVTTAGGYTCEAVVWMPEIFVHDSCQDTVHVDIIYPGGILKNHNGGDIKLLPGVNRVVYVASDGCYNEDSCIVYVTVLDKTPPVAVCQQNTVVSLTRDDVVHVYAEVFDDGSYDDCHIDSFKVRRMDNGDACNFRDTFFRPFVEFCCADAGKEVMVIFRVYDKAGNFNDCMVRVEIQDKTPPVIKCPHDVRIPCSKHNDTINLKKYGEPYYSDNCIVDMHEYVDSFLNQCGLGYIERVFVIKDNMNRYDTCRQRITIFDEDPFDGNDIIWPYDYHVNSCGADLDPKNLPDTFGYPIILDNDCSLIGISYEDHQFNYVQDTAVCFKVLRKWKVIDWCQCYYDTQAGQTVCPSWHHEQIIKVSNKLPPKITDDCDTVRVCISNQECLKERVTLSHEAKDDCTPDDKLFSSFKIDLYNNGLFDSTYAIIGNKITFDGELPIGEHRFLWIFDDQCGNREICTQIVQVVNCKIPTAYCHIGININIMGVDTNGDGILEGMIDVWAKDVDKGSYQFCGNPITLSFARDTNIKSIRYTCDSLGMRKVNLWVTDQVTGLQDFCITTVTIQDNNKVCKGTTTLTANVGGQLLTPFDQKVQEVTIKLDGPQGILYKEFNGNYQFDNLKIGNDYKVTAVVDKNYLDGVSTMDIVRIQRHILGVEAFPSPWHLLAADVTGDKRVTAADISALRKLILGVDSKYKNNLSWMFLESNYQFPDVNDPWSEPLPIEYSILGLPGPMMYMDFIGIKVGDVSQTTWSGLHKSETRNGNRWELAFGEPVKDHLIPVYAASDQLLSGLQFTLKFNANKLNVTGIKSGVLSISESNLGWSFVDKGYVLVSWNPEKDQLIQKGEILFYVETDQVILQGIENEMDLNSAVLNAEAYNENDEIVEISVRKDENILQADVVFGEPVPNPFSQSTSLRFFLKERSDVQYTISDLNGKLIYQKRESYQEGQNTLIIKQDVFVGPGVYLLKMEAGEYTKSMKLVMIVN
ncbi:MAG: T9SS type A sorting domain-containing protein [Saprospiraceae bacterium]|nr:T9SS type A sorting domain-containing protein [Saprospiraceae bacterium]MBK9720779.1 T9SS type A sorting domain-containing protein [Saprospiraceae bacterium]